MSKVAIQAPKLGPAVGPFSPAIASDGFVFLSGQVGVDPETRRLVEGDVAAQTAQAFVNLGVVLQAAGKTFGDVVRVGVYLTDIADFAAMNKVYAEHLEQPYPARTTIAVAALPLGASVEIDLIAR